ncbi:hypothetical protein HY030_01300 [Candidatus Gottesmanbacteria bacterium]|nr:hypothetical protein [Candidatus Gottesmanbacteria bacterium]
MLNITARRLFFFILFFILLIGFKPSKIFALSCLGVQTTCDTCSRNCRDVTVAKTCYSQTCGCPAEFCPIEPGCWSNEPYDCSYTQTVCDYYQCNCNYTPYPYTCPDDGSTCDGSEGCTAPPSGSGGGTTTGGNVGSGINSNPTPTPVNCFNESNCPPGKSVQCNGSQCSAGVSCWCGTIDNLGTGGGNCTTAANCTGTAPCPIGLSGSWYCNGGQCQSYCSTDNSAPPPDTSGGATPTPPPGCTPSSPSAPVLVSPANNATLGNTSVTFAWTGVSSWGENCTLGTAGYKVYADTNANPGTAVCTAPPGTTTCSANLTDQTVYKWKVVADNGALKSSSPIWTFTIKQPIISGTLYEDLNDNGCYNSSSGEQPVVNPNSIIVSVNGQSSSCTRTNSTYTCTVAGSNTSGQTTVVNLTTTGYNPQYSAQTNCATGENASCSVNNCSLSLSAGDNVSVNIGYTIKQWFQTNSCVVYSNGAIASIIPTAAQHFDTGAPVAKYLVLGQPGPVVTSSSTSHNFGTGGSASQPNWQDLNYPSITVQNYNFFKQKVAVRGTQIGSAGNLTLSGGNIVDGATSYPITNNSIWDINGNLNVVDGLSLSAINATILVSGNVAFSGNFTPPNSNFAFISHGNISVDPTVSQINGLFLSDGQFSSGVSFNQGLKVVGSVAASNGFVLGRKWQNYKPAEYFVCDASAFINLVPVLGLSSHTWTEIAP